MVTHNGNYAKIIDFGLADTDSHAILKQPAGTLRYMAPEQMQATVADVRNEDSWHNVYVLKFHTTDQGLLEVGVIGENDLKDLVMNKSAWGIMIHDSACFILFEEKPEGVFNKAKGKHSIIQEFEILDAYFEESHTVVYADWKGGKLRAKVYVINDHDNLSERQRKENGL